MFCCLLCLLVLLLVGFHVRGVLFVVALNWFLFELLDLLCRRFCIVLWVRLLL